MDHYVNYPSVLVRLSRVHLDSLQDLLGMAAFRQRQGEEEWNEGSEAKELVTDRFRGGSGARIGRLEDSNAHH